MQSAYAHFFPLMKLWSQGRKASTTNVKSSNFFAITSELHSFSTIDYFPISKNFEAIFLRFTPAPQLLKPYTLTFHRTYLYELPLWSLQSLVLPSSLTFSLSSINIFHSLPLVLRGKCLFLMSLSFKPLPFALLPVLYFFLFCPLKLYFQRSSMSLHYQIPTV